MIRLRTSGGTLSATLVGGRTRGGLTYSVRAGVDPAHDLLERRKEAERRPCDGLRGHPALAVVERTPLRSLLEHEQANADALRVAVPRAVDHRPGLPPEETADVLLVVAVVLVEHDRADVGVAELRQ